MSVGAWEPAKNPQPSATRQEISRELLQRAISVITAISASEALSKHLTGEDGQQSYLMRLPAQQWLEESQAWSDEQLWQLIQFFTLAEMQLPGWDAGADSPVIPLSKALRQRGTPLNREQLLWIREHSNNRYLPYGPL